MPLQDLWAELKRRRVVRVIVAYAVAVFVVLQVAELLVEPLGLPGWTYRFLILLTLIGFPVAVGLAWAFDVTPEGVTAAEDDDGHRATQGRWVLGGAVAVATAIGFWQLAGSSDEVVAEGVDPDVIAVVPFRVSSAAEGLSYLREGSLDLLSPFLSDSPRMVDASAMVSAWRREAATDEADLSEGEAIELARRLGAGRVVVASVVGSASSFTVTARLLQVPGGARIGDATEDGSEAQLREVFTRLAVQLLAMESGTEATRVEYLSSTSVDALKAYLEGRRLYRRAAYVAAREAFSRALDLDETFALAALGLTESTAMGLDSGRGAQTARAEGVLSAHLDELPPRDREYVELWLFQSGRMSAVETVEGPRAEMVRRLPDKPEAWYHFGDRLFHDAVRVADEDYSIRAAAAFERSLELDPGLLVSSQHLLWSAAQRADTSYMRSEAPRFLAEAAGTESALGIRAMMAWIFGDTAQARTLDEAIDTLSFPNILNGVFIGGFGPTSVSPEVEDRMLDRLLAAAITPGERSQALLYRYRYLMNAGRIAEAQQELAAREAIVGPQPGRWLLDHLLWDAPESLAREAARTIDAVHGDGSEPLAFGQGGQDLFRSELWRLREGMTDRVDRTLARLRAAQDDSDPAHGRNALLALTLEAMAAHERGAPGADSLVAGLDRVLGLGPPNFEVPNFELSRLLEARGDPSGAARAAQRTNGGVINPYYHSTSLHEGARLWDAAGEPERALPLYRHFLSMQRRADPELRPRLEQVRARIAELEAAVQ